MPIYKLHNSREDIELHSKLFCLMAKYGTKDTYAKELIDLQKLFDIDYNLTPEQMLDVLRQTANKVPGVPTISFIFADAYISTVLNAGKRLETPLSSSELEYVTLD